MIKRIFPGNFGNNLKSKIQNLKSAVVAGAMLLALSFPAEAQQAKKVPRIGALAGGTPASFASRYEAFRQGLRELGWVEGQNIAIEYRYAEGKMERLPDLAAELVRLKVNLILTAGDISVRVAKQATQTIPVVVAVSSDLVGSGYIASLARPGGNITGMSGFLELAGKRLELLKAAFPKVSRVAFLWNPTNAANVASFRETEVAAPAFGVQLFTLGVRRFDEFESAFQEATRGRPDALIAVADTFLLTYRARIVDFAAKNRLPAIYANQDYMDAGGLMFYGANVADQYRRAATYVDKILKGSKPADLPVEQPTKLELIINLKAAKQIGLTIPPNVLARADKVIK